MAQLCCAGGEGGTMLLVALEEQEVAEFMAPLGGEGGAVQDKRACQLAEQCT